VVPIDNVTDRAARELAVTILARSSAHSEQASSDGETKASSA
jgi:hypothetical protein